MSKPTTTAVAALTAALDPWAPGAEQDSIRLPRTTAEQLLQVIADLCPDHWACEDCGTAFCDNCLPDGDLTCPHDRLLCLGCAVEICPECRADAREDAQAEAYADMVGGRY
ncbi:hypothetical protein [Nocardioides pakistanensis]